MPQLTRLTWLVRLARPARWLFAVALVAGVASALFSQRHAMADGLARLSVGTVVGAFCCLLAGLLLSQRAWAVVLAGLGSPLGAFSSARIFFVGQLGKYLPGSVWPLFTQMQLGRKVGVPRARMGATGIIWLAFSVVTGLTASLLALPSLVQDDQGRGYVFGGLALLAGFSVTLHPLVLTRLLNRVLKLARRPLLEDTLQGRSVIAATLLLLGTWALFGLQLWLLAREVGTDRHLSLLTSIGAFALASTLGFLAILAPAGAGVRELVIVVALSPVLSTGDATAVAVVSRLLMTLADVLLGLVVLMPRSGRVPVDGSDLSVSAFRPEPP